MANQTKGVGNRIVAEETNISPAYLFSHKDKDMPKHYVSVSNLLQNSGYKVTFRYSANNVPHLVVHSGENFSICFFKNKGNYRVFTPYGKPGEQLKKDFTEPADILKYIREEE